LAVHRLDSVRITDRKFEIPDNYDFQRDFNQTFGIIKEQTFLVEAAFYGRAARFVSERSWSPDEKMTTYKDGHIKVVFSASSEPEIMSWMLSFGDQAKLLQPVHLQKTIAQKIKAMSSIYEQ